jgi:hypothetical protein
VQHFFFFWFLGVGWDWLHLVRWPLTGLLYQPGWWWWWWWWRGGVWSSRWNENWQGKPKYSEKTWPGIERRPPRWEAGD